MARTSLLSFSIIPENAVLLRKTYQTACQSSKEPSWVKVHKWFLEARLCAIATVPVAAITGLGFLVGGISRSLTHVTDLEFLKAVQALCEGLLKCVECLILGVVNCVYAAGGVFIGSYFLSYVNPESSFLQQPSPQQPLQIVVPLSDNRQPSPPLSNEPNRLDFVVIGERSEVRQPSPPLSNELQGEGNKPDVKEISEERQPSPPPIVQQVEGKKEIAEERQPSPPPIVGQIEGKKEIAEERQPSPPPIVQQVEGKKEIAEERQPSPPISNEQEIERYNALLNLLKHKLIEIEEKKKSEEFKKNICNLALEIIRLAQLLKFKVVEIPKEISDALNELFKEENKTSSPQKIREENNHVEEDDDSIDLGSVENLEKEFQSWFSRGVELCKNLLNPFYQYTRDFFVSIKQSFFDEGDLWKDYRYTQALQLLKSSSGDIPKKLETLLAQQNYNRKSSADLMRNHIFEALQLLRKVELKSGRKTYHAFQNSIRNSLQLCHKLKSSIHPDISSHLFELCHIWFTMQDMTDFYGNTVDYVSQDGFKKINRSSLSQETHADKLAALYAGIKNSSPAVRAPKANLAMAKIYGLLASFDPLGSTNMPTRIASFEYKNSSTQQTKTVVQFRTGVPVGPSSENSKDIELVPEYLAALHHLKKKGQKLLIICHLNPSLLDLSNFQVKEVHGIKENFIEMAKDHESQLKLREAYWIKKLIELSRSEEFRGVVDVALFPLDGELVKEMKEEKKVAADDFIYKLKSQLKSISSGFYIPVIRTEIQNGQLVYPKETLVENVVKDVRDHYFDGIDNYDMAQRQAFLSLVYSRMSEILALKLGSHYVQRNCKDGVDRTMALVGAELYEKIARLNPKLPQETEKKLFSLILGPALNVLKRAILKSRLDFALSTMSHLTELLNQKPLKKLPGVQINPSDPTTQYELAHIDLGGHYPQSSHPI